MIFWRKKATDNLRSDEYEILCKKLQSIQLESEANTSALRLLRTDVDNLCGRFNRQLSGMRKEEEKVAPKEEETQPKPLNTNSAKVFTGMVYP